MPYLRIHPDGGCAVERRLDGANQTGGWDWGGGIDLQRFWKIIKAQRAVLAHHKHLRFGLRPMGGLDRDQSGLAGFALQQQADEAPSHTTLSVDSAYGRAQPTAGRLNQFGRQWQQQAVIRGKLKVGAKEHGLADCTGIQLRPNGVTQPSKVFHDLNSVSRVLTAGDRKNAAARQGSKPPLEGRSDAAA